MNDVERKAYELMAGTSLTQYPVDNARAVALIRMGRDDTERKAIREMVMQRRAWWKVYLTTTQRKWQAFTRNPNKARHLDSIPTRERYVRCA